MRLRKHITYANIISIVTIMVALGGTSYAAIKVTGANIKDQTLTAKDVQNLSLSLADLSSGTVQSMTGPKGIRGLTGAKGDTGPLGLTGDKGPKGDSKHVASG